MTAGIAMVALSLGAVVIIAGSAVLRRLFGRRPDRDGGDRHVPLAEAGTPPRR